MTEGKKIKWEIKWWELTRVRFNVHLRTSRKRVQLLVQGQNPSDKKTPDKSHPDKRPPTISSQYKSAKKNPKESRGWNFFFRIGGPQTEQVSVNGIFLNNLFNNIRGLIVGGFCPGVFYPGGFLSGTFDRLPNFCIASSW